MSGGDSLTSELLFDREVISVQDRADADFGASTTTVIDVNQAACEATVTDARGKTTTFTFDARGRVTQSTDALGTKTELVWDDATTDDNNLIKLTEAAYTADDAVTDMTYNANGLLLTQKDPQAQVDVNRGTTQLTYLDGAGHSSQQSPRLSDGVSIDAGRTFVSDLATATDPRGTTRTLTYSADGRGT